MTFTIPDHEPRLSALDLYERLAQKDIPINKPTDEQREIIESRHFGPSVVIAGAGSGKTETMSIRVLWLVANGYVSPSQVLGLTFTRKAAGELNARIRLRLRQLRSAGLLPDDLLDITPSVSTYHAYAGRVLRSHGMRLGVDTDQPPIGDAMAWQLARDVVQKFSETEYRLDRSVNKVVEKVIKLASEMNEHSVTAEQIREVTLPLLEKLSPVDATNDATRDLIATLQERLAMLPMVERYKSIRFEKGMLTFDDHMAIVAELAEKFTDISESERLKYPVVILDEYQDTSYSQVRFLSGLFRNGHAVTAVGDPNQAIYGWRSANSRTLETFPEIFIGNSRSMCREHTLLTTWRNDEEIMALANRTIDELSLRNGSTNHPLRLRPDAKKGQLLCGQFENTSVEASAIAEQIAERWSAERLPSFSGKRPTFAVLVRSRKYIEEIDRALRERGIPTDVVGLSGLIHVPEVADVIALLRTVSLSDAGSSLMRLLAGPHLALGASDLAALGKFAQSFVDHFSSSIPSSTSSSQSSNSAISKNGEKEISRNRRFIDLIEHGSPETREADDFLLGSLIEALENFSQAPEKTFSPEGYQRLSDFSERLTHFRREMNGPLTDVVMAAERFLNIDSEVMVRDGWQHGRAHLDKFLDEAGKFERSGGTLLTFLQWLDTAQEREGGLKPAAVIENANAVQILTIHTAKGSEWDYVAIPGMVAKNFPSSGKESDLWIKNSGSLPVSLRGDRAELADFTFPSVGKKGGYPQAIDIKNAVDDYSSLWEERRLDEEMRLAYVAFTRAKKSLFISMAYFADGVNPLAPSLFYQWVEETIRKSGDPANISSLASPSGKNPTIENPRTAIWPKDDPISSQIIESADLVRASSATLSSLEVLVKKADARLRSWLEDAKALIREIELRRSHLSVILPPRLSVSSLIAMKESPEEFARAMRRPIPVHMDRFARRGTEFHLWLERKFTTPTLLDDEIFDPLTPDDFTLTELQEKWLASEWANRNPIDVEVPFETSLAGVLLRGRIDAVYLDEANDSGSHTGSSLEGGPEERSRKYLVVDWKTGRAKKGEDLATATIQLAMYRLAYSRLKGIPVENIGAAFHYVGDGQTIRPSDLYTEAELIGIIENYLRTSLTPNGR